MKQNIKFNSYSLIVTVGVLMLFVIGIFSVMGTDKLIPFCIIAGGVTIVGLYYCPKSVEANESGLTLHRLLSKPKVFPWSDIESVDTFYPSAGGLRLCASGGFFGFWGNFSDIMTGSYFGYYGSRDSCILVKMKDGKQYVIGCANPVALTDYIMATYLHCP